MSLAYPPAQNNGPLEPMPEDLTYWRTQLFKESAKCKRARWPPNPELVASVSAYWRELRGGGSGKTALNMYFKEVVNGRSTTST